MITDSTGRHWVTVGRAQRGRAARIDRSAAAAGCERADGPVPGSGVWGDGAGHRCRRHLHPPRDHRAAHVPAARPSQRRERRAEQGDGDPGGARVCARAGRAGDGPRRVRDK
eukprot:895434-Prorocentrum_minimum.AAC.3